MYNKLLYSRLLEQHNLLDHYLKYVLPTSNFHIVTFFQSEGGGGYYEVWDLHKHQSILKKSFLTVEQMTTPIDYRPHEIAFFNTETLKLNILRYLDAVCIETPLSLPSPRLVSYLSELQEEQKLTYFQHCLRYAQAHSRAQNPNLFILEERFNVFSGPDGRCDDYYFSAWDIEQHKLLSETTIEHPNQILFMAPLPSFQLIYRQYFSEEPFYFYVWAPTLNTSHKVQLKANISGTVIAVFETTRYTVIKQEIPSSVQEVLFVLNTIGNSILLLVTFDQTFNPFTHKVVALEIDKHPLFLIQVPWQMSNEYLIQAYTKTYQSMIAIIDFDTLEVHKLHTLKHEQRLSEFYFSKEPKHFIEVYEDRTKRPLKQEMQLPDQTEEVIQFVEHCFIPYSLYYFHFLYQNHVTLNFGERTAYELMRMTFDPLPARKVKNE